MKISIILKKLAMRNKIWNFLNYGTNLNNVSKFFEDNCK